MKEMPAVYGVASYCCYYVALQPTVSG